MYRMKGKKQMNVLILKGMIVFMNAGKLLTTLTCDPLQDKIIFQSSTAARVFKSVHIKKASGPDGISPYLKTFADELSPV